LARTATAQSATGGCQGLGYPGRIAMRPRETDRCQFSGCSEGFAPLRFFLSQDWGSRGVMSRMTSTGGSLRPVGRMSCLPDLTVALYFHTWTCWPWYIRTQGEHRELSSLQRHRGIVEYERIELDYCTNCSGVWFDAESWNSWRSAVTDGEAFSLQDVMTLPTPSVREAQALSHMREEDEEVHVARSQGAPRRLSKAGRNLVRQRRSDPGAGQLKSKGRGGEAGAGDQLSRGSLQAR